MTTDSTNKTPRNNRRAFVGTVVSDKASKTRVVSVQRLVRHPRYEKIVRRRSKFYVHDEKNASHVGDRVEIMSARPMSKLKRWRLVRIIKAAERLEVGTTVISKEAAA
ncbi:MAG: 30S ribosomal protein S17 [Elusimicrobiota bacterium]